MRSAKRMLSSVRLMPLSLFLALVKLGRDSWLSGAVVILLLLSPVTKTTSLNSRK